MQSATTCFTGNTIETAITQVRKDLRLAERGQPSFLAIYHSSAWAADSVRTRLNAEPDLRTFHGATSCLGVMSEQGCAIAGGQGFGAFAVWDDAGDYGTAAVPFGDDPMAAARMAVSLALERADRPGESPELVWLNATPGVEEAVIAGIEAEVGSSTPIVGGSAADNAVEGAWQVFDADGAYSAGVTVSVLFPSGPLTYAFQSGYAPGAHGGVVTAAKGRQIQEIDNQAALEVYDQWTDRVLALSAADRERSILADSTWMPLGREVTRVADVPFYLLAHPASAGADGAIGVFADVKVGERVRVMHSSPEALIRRAGTVAQLAIDSGELPSEQIGGALVVFCGGSMLAMRERMPEVVASLNLVLGQTPWLGVFTFGEQGPVLGSANQHGNLMVSCVAFST